MQVNFSSAFRQVKFSAIWKRFYSPFNYFKDIGLTTLTCTQVFFTSVEQ